MDTTLRHDQRAAADGSAGDPTVLGARLRELREASGLSLRELARRLDISASAVSQIELGQLRPSVNRLIAMTGAIGVPLATVFESPRTPDVDPDGLGHNYLLARHGQIAPIQLEGGVIFRSLSPIPSNRVQFFESTYPPGSTGSLHGDLLRHEGVEVGHVTSGELTIVFDAERVVMRTGDSITFPCDVPHLLVNESDSVAIATWLITP